MPQPLWLNMTHSPCCCIKFTCTAHRSAGSLRIVYFPLFVVMVHWGTSYKWTGIWQDLFDVERGGVGEGGRVLGVTYFLRRQGLLVWWSALCAPPSLSLSPCVSPPLQPACMPDRQTDAICCASPALGLYHSPQTAHCLHTGCKFRLPLSLQIRANISDRTYFMYEM